MSHVRLFHVAVFALSFALSGCGGGLAEPFYPRSASSAITYTLSSGGQSIALTAVGQAVTLTITSAGTYTVTSGAPAVASVAGAGANVYTVTGVGAGTTAIEISDAAGSVSVPVTVTITGGIVETSPR